MDSDAREFDAENVYRVFDWLWSSGQLSARDIARLPQLHIALVINLAPPSASNALPGEAELITGLGINYLQIPVDWQAPKLEQLHDFFATADAYAGRRIWLHCAKNMRASVFVYLYRRLHLAHTDEEARFPLQQIWAPNPTWQAFINAASVEAIKL
ncbi:MULTISPECIES: protein tyrosine phosphatase family protein [Methylomonas]|uniref:protein tyrosine phosphatase family protein n=1 Tax=Methylomonas TaxID=416 RepID=UPI001232672C|nr:protein tyrosine phosphatase family protein [Methylomonas rhizoryzae]